MGKGKAKARPHATDRREAAPPRGEMLQLLDDDGALLPGAAAPALSATDLQAMYRTMWLSRLLDTRMLALQRMGKVGFYGTCTGEEAATIGSAYAARADDWIFPALRQGAAMLLRGFPLTAFVAQLLGNTLDVLQGHQMPCHFADRGVHFVAWSSCIATQLPHAVGAAWAARYLGDDMVALAYLGDGATSEGDFHAAMNFAGVWKAPVVFVCQNNQFAISVPVSLQTASPSIAIKAAGYGMPGVRVDGNDALAMYHATHEAMDRARGGGGPTFIEAVTYRMGGHSSSDDPTRYRDGAAMEQWARRDPIRRLKRYMESTGAWSEEQETRLDEELNDAVTRAIREAEAAPPPAPASMFSHVYAGLPGHIAEQRAQVLGERDRDRGPGGAFPL